VFTRVRTTQRHCVKLRIMLGYFTRIMKDVRSTTHKTGRSTLTLFPGQYMNHFFHTCRPYQSAAFVTRDTYTRILKSLLIIPRANKASNERHSSCYCVNRIYLLLSFVPSIPNWSLLPSCDIKAHTHCKLYNYFFDDDGRSTHCAINHRPVQFKLF
jgi:hypothetical protein